MLVLFEKCPELVFSHVSSVPATATLCVSIATLADVSINFICVGTNDVDVTWSRL